MSRKSDNTVHYWLMKSEPATFGIDDLKRKKRSIWDGVRNYQVRNFLRDEFRVGDMALFYHSSCKEVGVAGEMAVVKAGYPDPTQFDPKSPYYDEGSTPDNPRWLAVDVAFGSKFTRIVTLTELKALSIMTDSPLLKRGNRLSIVPLSARQYEEIRTLGTAT